MRECEHDRDSRRSTARFQRRFRAEPVPVPTTYPMQLTRDDLRRRLPGSAHAEIASNGSGSPAHRSTMTTCTLFAGSSTSTR